ncbi:replication protein A 32 kDa subunit isoform X2 [Oryzias melastigma]|uniref:Replication factor A protein 2 n=1 Tax=Oryzias melastigma TaxID=30732 RepID=A0A3B3DTN3_ORYME|nr:replication protein A 32 kDa subunit isoform X2 [Oryzias melastigma]
MWNSDLGVFTETDTAGGYTQSPGGFASPTLLQDKRGKVRSAQIIPCTVSQLMSATPTDEAYKVGEVNINQVTIVGIIRSTDKSTTFIQYMVDDMTCAPMDVKHWLDTEDPSVNSNALPPGTYVKVSGNLRIFQNRKSMVAFRIRALEDMNEITSHMLEVVHAHMALSKPQNTSVGGMMAGSASKAMIGGMGGSYPGANDMVNNGLSANQNQVLSLIRGCPDQQGISIHDLKQRLGGMSVAVIKQAVEFLSNEGHIFSTIDEDHFKSTDND